MHLNFKYGPLMRFPNSKQVKCRQCCQIYYQDAGKGPGREFCSTKCHNRYKRANRLQKDWRR
jgi:hypothetical protein